MDRQTDTQRNRKSRSHTFSEAGRQTYKQAGRQTGTYRDRENYTDTGRHAYRGETAIKNGNIVHGKTMFLATIVLGAIFLVGVVIEWSIAEFSVSEGYGTSFFSMTGLHASHVATGLIFLALAYKHASKGTYAAGNTWGATGVVMYWHFVDVVWVFFYPALYLVS